jgi:hypothetical protein
MHHLTTTLTDSELLLAGRAMERRGFSDIGDFAKAALLEYAQETLSQNNPKPTTEK